MTKEHRGKDVLKCHQVKNREIRNSLWENLEWALLILFYLWLMIDDEMDEEGSARGTKTLGRETSTSYQFVKRQRRRTSSLERSRNISVTVTSFDYSSSGDETIYSAQGNTELY